MIMIHDPSGADDDDVCIAELLQHEDLDEA